MEQLCMQCIPLKSYNLCGRIVLLVFVAFASGLMGYGRELKATSNLSCNLGKNVAADIADIRRKTTYVEKTCSLKYDEKYNSPLSLYTIVCLNFGLQIVLCIIYAFIAKTRVERWASKPATSPSTNPDNLELLQVPPQQSQRSQRNDEDDTNPSIPVLYIYVLHLFFRLLFMILFVVWIPYPATHSITTTNFPCPWSSATSSNANTTDINPTSVTIVDCNILLSSKRRNLAIAAWIWNISFFLITLVEAVYLLWQNWKDKHFRQDFEFCTIYLLKERNTIRYIIYNYKKKLELANDKDMFNLTALSGKNATLDKMYVNLIVETREELKINVKHIPPMTNATLVKKIETDVFYDNYGNYRYKIFVVGPPGIGKTVFTKKILHLWITASAKDKFWSEKLVILFRFRKFNAEQNKNTNLKNMLSLGEGLPDGGDFDGLYEYILSNPEKVILIFDGLDELQVDCDNCWTDEEDTPNYITRCMSIFSVFKKLVCGDFLPGATVLITSRPTSIAEQIYHRLIHVFNGKFEILGFTKPEIKEYVGRFCQANNDISTKMWELIENSPELLSLCNIPMSCCIICLILEKCSELKFKPKTITELYEMAIKTILMLHNPSYKNSANWKNYLKADLPEDLKCTLDKLKTLAKDAMKKGKLTFEIKPESESHAMRNCGFLKSLPNKSHCFLHLTIQKFLAAKKLVDEISSPEDVESFLSTHIADANWHLVIQFFAGLLADKFRADKSSMEKMCKSFEERIPSITSSQVANNERTVLLIIIKCLYEMQECGIMELAASKVGGYCSLNNLNIRPVDYTALFQFLGYVKSSLRLDLSKNHIDCSKLARFLCENDKVIELNLSSNNINDGGVKHLCDALINGNCKITNLNLSNNEIKNDGAKRLYDALINENCKITNLNLSNNEIKDEGVKHLCDALKNGNCKILIM